MGQLSTANNLSINGRVLLSAVYELTDERCPDVSLSDVTRAARIQPSDLHACFLELTGKGYIKRSNTRPVPPPRTVEELLDGIMPIHRFASKAKMYMNRLGSEDSASIFLFAMEPAFKRLFNARIEITAKGMARVLRGSTTASRRGHLARATPDAHA